MWLAIDTSTDLVSVALGRPGQCLGREQTCGPREHARALVPMVDKVLRAQGIGLESLRGVLVTDGPGSFTGLRIGAAVAKGLVQSHGLDLWTAPSLLVQAAGAVSECHGRILALSDALRGHLYAAMYRFPAGRVEIDMAPQVIIPEKAAGQLPRPRVIVSGGLAQDWELFPEWRDQGTVLWVEAQPNAAVLLELLARSGGVQRVPDEAVMQWEPSYGRPAEAQVQWERHHGRPLPDRDAPS